MERRFLRPMIPLPATMTGNPDMQKLSAEFLGALILVLVGCGAAVLGGEHVGQLGIAIAFGLAIVAGAYAPEPKQPILLRPV